MSKLNTTLTTELTASGDVNFTQHHRVVLNEADLKTLNGFSEDQLFLLAGAAYASGMRPPSRSTCKANSRKPKEEEIPL